MGFKMLMIVQRNIQSGVGSVVSSVISGAETAATSIETIFKSGQDWKQIGRGCRFEWMGNSM